MRPRSTKRSAALLACLTACWTAFTGVSTARADVPDVEPVITQLIVRVDTAETSIAAVNAVASTSTVAASISNNGSYLVNLPAGADVDATVAKIEAMPGVDWAVPNVPLTAPELEADRMYAWRMYAWALGTPLPAESAYAPAAVNLAAAQRTATGAGVVVAVVDTGVQPDHAALAGSIVAGRDFVEGDNAPFETANGIDDDGDGRIDEGTGHGTHVAGVIHQVAPAAKIMPVRVLDDDGTGSMWAATEGMYWAGLHGAKVINASIGTHGSAHPLRDAVTALNGQGVLVVAAAGNDGKDRPQYPAAAPEAIAVGSVGAGDVMSTFSNYGRWLDVLAPGENIHSTFAFPIGSYAMNSGTSMATPWVAGAAALLVSARPDATPDRVTTAIKAGAVSVISVNPTLAGKLGSGRLDIAASMKKI